MNKRNKNGLKWLILILVLLVTGFTVSMVACGLFKEKSSEKVSEEEESEESLYDTDAYVNSSELQNIQNAATGQITFAIDELPDTIEPCGMCVYEDALYVADSFSKCVWKVTDSSAETLAGADSSRDIYDVPQGGYNDADAGEALFKSPWSVAPFIGGIAVSDTDNNAIRIINDDRVDTLNSSDNAAAYDYPTGICADDTGNLFIADTHADVIKLVFSDGTVSTFVDGLESPMGVFFQGGYLYIAETGKNRIVRVDASDLSVPKSKGDIETVAGTGEEGQDDGSAFSSTFSSPKGIAVTEDGTIYVADTVNGAVRCIKEGRVSTLKIKDDLSPDAELISPVGICIQGGMIYVGDTFSRRIFIIYI